MPIMTSHIRQRTKQLLADIPRLLEDPDRRDTLRLAVTRLDKVAESLAGEEQKIHQNAHLTPEGRRVQLRDLASKKAKEVTFLQEALTKASDSHTFLSDSLFTTEGQRLLHKAYGRELAPLEVDPTLRFLRESEIRADWKNKAQPERDAEYLRAVQARDLETVRALSTAPGRPLVTSDLKCRADREHAEQHFPAAYENYVQVDALREQLAGLNELTGQWLAGLGTQS
jgi:hypothetical protein